MKRVRVWSGAAAVVAALALVVCIPRFGFGKAGAPLWTERPAMSAPQPAPAPASPWVALARELKPAVVNISTKRVQEGPGMRSPFGNDSPFNEFFKQFFDGQPRRTVRSLGSGFIINPDGMIVTNNHVVDGAREIKATLSDGREFAAQVLGRDARTDLALLKIEAHGLAVVPLGDSSQLQVGEAVMAIGNPFGLEQTVTTGIVSATGRVIGEGPYDDFIQTDASINPGNSGGPLINAQGQAIGINAAIFTQTGGSVGIGFAIPINLAKPVLTQLADSGRVVRGYLGVTVQRVTPDLAKSFGLAGARGALVASVVEGAPAARAGVKPGDVITDYDGRALARSDDLPRAVAETPVGREVPLTVVRDGKPLALHATIAKLAEPEERVTEAAGPPSLGLALQTLTPGLARELGLPARAGVLVRGVEAGSPAASAGLRAGDVIAEVDRHAIKSVDDMKTAIARRPAGAPVLFLVHRRGGDLYIALAS
jgi:serine protease Do